MGLSKEGKGALPTSPPMSLVLGPHSGTARRCIAGYIFVSKCSRSLEVNSLKLALKKECLLCETHMQIVFNCMLNHLNIALFIIIVRGFLSKYYVLPTRGTCMHGSGIFM